MENILDIVDMVRDYLDRNDWKYEYDGAADNHLIRAGVNVKCKLQNVQLYVLFNKNGYTVWGVPRLKADENTKAAVLEYITRANYGLRNGNFEMSMDKGEVRYKVYVNCKGMNGLSEDVLGDSIILPVAMLEKYGDGLASLIFGFSDPVTEVNKAEGKS